MNFCRRCGTPLTLIHDHVYECENKHAIYDNASPASCLWIVNDKDEVLLTVRAHAPGAGSFDAPGGFNDGPEIFEDGLSRELLEEVGLSPTDYTTPQYLTSALDSYEFGGESRYVLSGVFWARLIGNPVIKADDDVESATFVPISSIDPDTIYFDAVRAGFIKLSQVLGVK
jgi:ADP-ribose pyrophosphatase YjhB (NUDIX family)